MSNSTFCGAEPFWANACVGNNGNPTYVQYSKGYSQAANTLIDLVLSGRGIELAVDDFIYPVCFNMRHSIELRLKGAIEELIKIAEIRGLSLDFNLSGSHDIGNIWFFFKRESEELDSRYEEYNLLIDSTIRDVAEIDSTGQTFRYPVDVESQKHLTEVATINFLVLKVKFNHLEENLDKLHYLNTYLLEEYKLMTFTKKMSRLQLFHLAKDLPSRDKWKADNFNQTKIDLRDKYGLSSNDLTKAINLILSNYEMAPMIGGLIDLQGIGYEDLYMLLDEWVAINPEVSNRSLGTLGFEVVSTSDTDSMVKAFQKSQESRAARNVVWEKLKDVITPEKLAGIKALFYFARELKFCEYYLITYEYELKEASSYHKSNDKEFKNSFMHLFSKSNFVENIIESLYFLKHTELADQIISRYELSESFSWIEGAKSRDKFKLPDICGYNKI